MNGTEDHEETDHPELMEFAGETLGDTLTNLITEIIRLREGIKAYLDLDIETSELRELIE